MAMKDGVRRGRRTKAAVVLTSVVVIIAAVALGNVLGGGGGPRLSSTATVGSLTSAGVACTDPSLSATAAQAEGDPRFTQLSDGLCYSFVGTGDSAVGGSDIAALYTFDYYNGSVIYPCGTFPQALVVSQIQAEVVANGSRSVVQSAELVNDTASLNSATGCGPDRPPVSVVSAQLVEVTIPAVLEVNLTLDAPSPPQPVTALKAVILVPGANQTIEFSGVTPRNPLSAGRSASQISIITGPAGFTAGEVFEMAIEGKYQGGQSFEYTVEIALVST